MPNSLSKQIVQAIVAKIEAPGMPNGLTVKRSRTVSIADDELPLVSIYRLKEDPSVPSNGNPRLPSMLQRNLIVEILIAASQGDDACDPYQQWIVAQLASDPKLGGLAKSVLEINTEWDPEEGSLGSSMTTFLRYRVEYFTTPGDITKQV